MEKVGGQQGMTRYQGQRLGENDRIGIPWQHLPNFRSHVAIQDRVEKRLIFKTWGGIGDQICAEPTLRYVLEHFKGVEISLSSEAPDLFKHLHHKFKKVFDTNEEVPNYKRYLSFETIAPPGETNLVWQFFSHLLVNCVDFPALCSIRSQLPIKDRNIILTGDPPKNLTDQAFVRDGVLVHPGKHWQSKTFPKGFWDRVLAGLMTRGITPVLIGADADDNRGTVDVDVKGCIDLRNKLSLRESIWACQNSKVLLTNDSAPLHMAASGKAWIGYIATCKHPDMITHYRLNEYLCPEFQWREVNFGKGGVWEYINNCPNQPETVEVEFVEPKLLESWLPEPSEMAAWAAEKVSGK